MRDMNRTMRHAMKLIHGGDLETATRAIQSALRANGSDRVDTTSGMSSPSEDCIPGEFVVIADSPGQPTPSHPESDGHFSNRAHGSEEEFRDDVFACDAGEIHYKLFIPAGLDPMAAPPLVVMLHGCTQAPDDFARGTRMNAQAQRHGYIVAYPAQSSQKNPNKCWNWFRRQDQRRGRGEAALLAALTLHLVSARGIDASRVYAAGLSAGGAMAAVLANAYPEIYAAIGVHSGLPCGIAHDLPSALAAMGNGVGISATAPSSEPLERVPAIVFHGDRDTTVNLRNAAAIVAQRIGSDPLAVQTEAPEERRAAERGCVPGGRAYTRTIFRNADGLVVAESWVIHGAGHAWSGGSAAGSYTDASGPDAAEHMLRFFATCGGLANR